MTTKFWQLDVSTTEHWIRFPSSLLLVVHILVNSKATLLGPETLDSSSTLLFFSQSIPNPAADTLMAGALSPHPCTLPCPGLLARLQICSMRSLSELFFCSLWLPCSSSPRYPRGAFPNLIHVSFQISHYLRRFLWWPSPILSPPISLTWFIQFHSAYYHRAHSMHVYLYLSPSRMQASQVQGLCMVYCYTPHAWDSVWPSKYIEWRNDWWLCSGIRVCVYVVTIIGFML